MWSFLLFLWMFFCWSFSYNNKRIGVCPQHVFEQVKVLNSLEFYTFLQLRVQQPKIIITCQLKSKIYTVWIKLYKKIELFEGQVTLYKVQGSGKAHTWQLKCKESRFPWPVRSLIMTINQDSRQSCPACHTLSMWVPSLWGSLPTRFTVSVSSWNGSFSEYLKQSTWSRPGSFVSLISEVLAKLGTCWNHMNRNCFHPSMFILK